VYRTRISPKRRSLTIAKVRYQPHKAWVTSWVTHDAPIELPRKIELGCQEISEKADTWSHAIALLDLYSISRAEFEHPTTSSRARARLQRGERRSETVVSWPKKPALDALEMAVANCSLVRIGCWSGLHQFTRRAYRWLRKARSCSECRVRQNCTYIAMHWRSLQARKLDGIGWTIGCA
jgi:hypothetical protein